ncbi:MAG: signal peptidase I, partial [Clostridia bacterium]
IVGQSMEPTIQKGDIVIIKSIKENELKLQDIITFAESKNSLTTHRVVRIDEAGKIYVKGDNGISEDNVTIEFSQVKGRVVYILKGSGKFFDYVCEISNLTFIILSFVAINLINSIVKKL